MDLFTASIAAVALVYSIFATIRWMDARDEAALWENIADELSEGVAHLNRKLAYANSVVIEMQEQGDLFK